MKNIRVRFAPSPTGALHIGGVRTALYNYLLAKKHGGTFILRIEDTDQTRYVPNAEKYIVEALEWCGLTPDEGPDFGGDYGPYRQSERKAMYLEYALRMVESGNAYYAFDTGEELDAKREEEKAKGNHSFKYSAANRGEMNNSTTLSADEVKARLDSGAPYTIRLKIPSDEIITIHDLVRGEVKFQSNELDDKIIMKSDGMPTYHLANIVDDYSMKISHVIRGEEWLPSTAHHVLMYRFLGWESEMPKFSHLPLILKPTGKGKLSKRDGAKLGIPVFPLSWNADKAEDSFVGFREFGFDPDAVNNFLAFLGWNPGTEQEIFSLDELCDAFSIEKISKAGARFDFDKAKWFNQQYIIAAENADLAKQIRPMVEAQGHQPTDAFLEAFVGMLKERVNFFPDFWEQGYYFFEDVKTYDEKTIRKRWKLDNQEKFNNLLTILDNVENFNAADIKSTVEKFITDNELSFGIVLPILRIATSGTMKGPDVFQLLELIGKTTTIERLKKGYTRFNEIAEAKLNG
jgi:glutamyl-tRNA synthetase